MNLWPFQVRAIDQLDQAVAAGSRAPLLVLPTGSGKTTIATELIGRRDQRALFLAPRRELVHQASARLAVAGILHGVLLAGADERKNGSARVQVASIDTLVSRMLRRNRLTLGDFDLVLVDEAHLSITDVRRRLLACWPNALRIGLTATPTRKDGRALGVLYDRLIEPATVAELQRDGFLVPARYFSISEPDLDRVRTIGGDYHGRDLEKAVNQPQLVGDIVQTWLARAGDRRTVVFCTSIAHSVAVSEAFQRAGVATEHVDASTPTAEREAIFERFSTGRTQILTNCFLASYGFDLPVLSCVVLARPTKSLMLYLQMLGRGLRIAESKSDCLVLDHSGCVHRHGFAHDERPWTLEGEFSLVRDATSAARETAEARQIDCPECAAVFSGTRTCPSCGYYLAPKGKIVETIDGELVEVGASLQPDQQDRLEFYLELRGFARERNYSPKWPAAQYRSKFGTWPPWSWNDLPAAAPGLVTRRWCKSRLIAWRKAQQSNNPREYAT